MKKRLVFAYAVFLILVVGIIYIFFQPQTLYGGDAGDLLSAIATEGVAHPPGYPLYTALGIVLSRLLPFGSLAYRVGFLSTISSLTTILLVYLLSVYLIQSPQISLIAALTLAFVYPYWLYSEVVEVFALNNLFIISLLYLAIRYFRENRMKFLYLASFIFGLSLTHHHIIFFILPALIFLFIKRKSRLKQGQLSRAFLFFGLGFIPYLYVVISAASNPALNWMGDADLSHFLRLVTRASYGTFVAGGFIAHSPLLRLVDIFAFFNFLFHDFRPAGIILTLLGLLYFYKQNKDVFYCLTIAITSYLFFLFYASFPLVNNFFLGTFERFILPLYLLMILALSNGIKYIFVIIDASIFRNFSHEKKKQVSYWVSAVFFLLPITMFTISKPRIAPLQKNIAAEQLASDILNHIPTNSILLLSVDTTLFNTQYLYYAQKEWSDIKLVHVSKLYNGYYLRTLKKHNSDIDLSSFNPTAKGQLDNFLALNAKLYPIYSLENYQSSSGGFAPSGLLFRFYPNGEDIEDSKVVQTSEKMWQKYHSPDSKDVVFQNLLLSDVLRVYAQARQETAFWYAQKGYDDLAINHLVKAQKMWPIDPDSYIILSQIFIKQKKCSLAQNQLDKLKKIDEEDARFYLLTSFNYLLCHNDQKSADYYQKIFELKEKAKETELKKL